MSDTDIGGARIVEDRQIPAGGRSGGGALPDELVSVVVSYFNPRRAERLRLMTQLCLSCLAECTASRLELLLLDGSGAPCADMIRFCASIGASYHAAPEPERFARTYNRGLAMARGDLLVTCASDILVAPGWDTPLRTELRRTGAAMAAPYLSASDYPAQVWHWVIRRRTFVPSFLTFNLNMMTRQCWSMVGALDEQFGGSYNDIDYLLRMRAAGLEVIVADAGAICHYGRLTVSTWTFHRHSSDHDLFVAKYPGVVRDGAVDCSGPLFNRSPTYAGLRRLLRRLPERAGRAPLSRLLSRFEPLFHAR